MACRGRRSRPVRSAASARWSAPSCRHRLTDRPPASLPVRLLQVKPGGVVLTPAMLTDRYELTMIEAARSSGAAARRCVFEVFARSLPDRRRYGVVAGLGRLLADLPWFSFDEESLEYLLSSGV